MAKTIMFNNTEYELISEYESNTDYIQSLTLMFAAITDGIIRVVEYRSTFYKFYKGGVDVTINKMILVPKEFSALLEFIERSGVMFLKK